MVTLTGDTAKLEGGREVATLAEVDWEDEMRKVHPEVAEKAQAKALRPLEGRAAGYLPNAFYSFFRVVAKDHVGLAGFELFGTLRKKTKEVAMMSGKYQGTHPASPVLSGRS